MAENISQRYELRLRAHPQTLADVRRAVAARLRLWGREELISAAGMCVTELLSNVHKHASSPECVLILENLPDGIQAAVSDTESALPVVKEPDFLSESGRGMFLLSKTADAWGTDLTPTGKTVWFTLRAEAVEP
ncbi:ATP-binding protein [Streptomyces sp. NPDC044780]|uniref:ATP-binding protein n=1 Tax=Streptomyces luomodiensis TaxID=3026192 RepID=A0ABY9UWY6_9ACTN|nr:MULTISPECIES: ATP-binding protein [unclassified Streptomyces]WAP56249.1 ATP-binding protein [Streptomyces sp. S465]WNE96806.1 ATP-binding protein [Streptomyces sp. SCA4-21]